MRTLGHGLITLLMASFFVLFMATAKAENFSSTFFQVELPSEWQVVKPNQNMPNSVNVIFKNNVARSQVNIAIGSAWLTPYAFLTDLQSSIRANKGSAQGVLQKGDLLYINYSLNGLNGFACAATNGRDTATMVILGNPDAGKKLIRSFRNTKSGLFPSLP